MEGTGDHELMDLDESKAGFSFNIKPLGLPSSLKNSKSIRKNPSSLILLKLYRIRDVVSLWLSYMRTVHDCKLKNWIHRVSNVHCSILERYHLIQEKPLQYLEGIVPKEMMMENKIEAGDISMFGHNDDYNTPDVILNLAADLAIDQLLQTLLSRDYHVSNIHHVMISTRNNDERREFFETMKVVLKDMDNVPCFNAIFHGVLWVDVSMNPSRVKVEVLVEQQIRLQLQLPKFTEYILPGMNKKKYLVLLLDGDGEKIIDLRKLSFPAHVREAVMVLITTEFQKQANDEKTISMDLKISTKDHLLPWKVFCQNAGKKLVFSTSEVQKIAIRIVQECGGHLLAIVIVAKSLKDVKDVKRWELALNKLCRVDPGIYIQGVSKVMVTAFINFIWNDLNPTQKHCLMSCLFIPDIKAGKLSDQLMDHWISSQLTDDREAMHNLRVLVERSILLQDQSNDNYVQLPVDTYAILYSLNTLTPLFMRKSGLELIEPPKDELWHSVVHMELANNKISDLPLSPKSPELKVLMLQGNADLTRIPNMFFFKMPLLMILDLSYTSVRELPDSLFELERLRELYLKGCECFMKLSSKIGKLKKLEKLDLDGTQIIHMPKEIQELTDLQSLILCFYEYRGKKSKQYTSSTIIPPEVISKLKRLKHLSIDVNPDDERWYENVQDILPEILGLKRLLTLSLYIPHLELLKLIPDRIFEVDFRFIVGRHMQRIITSTPSTCEAKFKQSGCSLKFVNGADIPIEIKKLVRHSKALFLERHKTIKNLSEFQMMNLEQLRACVLAECREMQTIVDGRQSNSGNDIFSHLLYLYVSHMKSLRSIWEGPTPPRCFFGMLKSLVLQNCPKLTTVFTSDFLGNLSLLKELLIKDCPKVSTLISDESFQHVGDYCLPKLRKILLIHLPKLINISNRCHIAPSLEKMAIYDCPKLQSLSKMELSSKNLKVIKAETKWWDALQWNKEEWGITYPPSKFDCIFSSIDNQVDIMTQFGVDDDDIDDNPDLESFSCLDDSVLTTSDNHPVAKEPYDSSTPNDQGCQATKQVQRIDKTPFPHDITYSGIHTCTQASSVVNAYKNNQIDVMTQIWRVDYIDVNPGGIVGKPLRPSNDEVFKDKRHSWKMRNDSPRWTKQSESLDDGFSWRKYGQREVRGCKHPRGYYRCTHGHSMGCLAAKRVQRNDENPSLYDITYRGYHTCTQASSVTDSSINKQVDLMTQFGVHDDDIKDDIAGEPLQPSSVRIFEDQKQIADRNSGMTLSVSTKVSKDKTPLQPSSARIFKDPKQSAERNSRMTSKKVPGGEETLIDRYGWKKYDQRQFGSENLSYYKCVDVGCPVKKRVQRSSLDSYIVTTYKGRHTCTQSSIVTDCSVNNQVDLMTQFEEDDNDKDNDADPKSFSFLVDSECTTFSDDPVTKEADDYIDIDTTITTGDIAVKPLQPSSDKVSKRIGMYSKRTATSTWTVESGSPEDEHSWRTYGQKVILGSKFPRSYFRCIHKFDEGCRAVKHVQMIQEQPVCYRTTYNGYHTCSSLVEHENTPSNSSEMPCFQNTFPNSTDGSVISNNE